MKKLLILLVLMIAVFVNGCKDDKVGKTKFRIAWSHYTGWEPWGWASDAGILKKWADKYGIEIELVLVNDYVESINLYTGGKFHGCTMTNMDALAMPAVGGVDSTALIIGDFSNGNDGIVIKKGESVADLKGQKLKLVELSVSHYLLARALGMNGMSEKDVTLVNTSDADIASLFVSDPAGAVVTWNPPLMQVRKHAEAKLVFDSSKIPGEIIDMLVVRTDAPDKLKKALVGAWYETMTIMAGSGGKTDEALKAMAKQAGGSLEDFKAQLKTTKMFYTPAEGATFAKGPQLKQTMEYVRTFSFDHGLYGEGAKSKDLVGIQFPDGTVIGDKGNVKLRFDAKYMDLAVQGKL